MIWESVYWKEELFKHALRIRRRQTLKRWVERSTASLEKDLMIGFYSIRKLVEAHKVSDEIGDRPLKLKGYPWTGSPITFMNWDKIDKHYDLEHPITITKPLTWVANLIIHSFVFLPEFDEGGRLDAILFNSDRTRRQHLYSLSVDEIIALFEEVGSDYPATMQGQFNEKTGDYDVQMGRQPKCDDDF